jgi:hypothetical protein
MTPQEMLFTIGHTVMAMSKIEQSLAVASLQNDLVNQDRMHAICAQMCSLLDHQCRILNMEVGSLSGMPQEALDEYRQKRLVHFCLLPNGARLERLA